MRGGAALAEYQRAHMKKFASGQAEFAKQQLFEQQRSDLVALREKIFVGGRRKYSKQVRAQLLSSPSPARIPYFHPCFV